MLWFLTLIRENGYFSYPGFPRLLFLRLTGWKRKFLWACSVVSRINGDLENLELFALPRRIILFTIMFVSDLNESNRHTQKCYNATKNARGIEDDEW